jgi:hypothetical protein
LGWKFVQLFHKLHDIGEESRCGTDDEGITHWFRNYHHLRFDLLERAKNTGGRKLELPLSAEEFVDGSGYIHRWGIFKSVYGSDPLSDFLFIQPQKKGFDNSQVPPRTGSDDAVGSDVYRKSQWYEGGFSLGPGKLSPCWLRGKQSPQ